MECRRVESEMVGDGQGHADEVDKAYHDTCLKHWYTGDMLIPIDLSILFNSKLSSVSGGIPRLSFRMFCRTHTKRLVCLNSMLCQTRSLRTTCTLFTIRLSILHSGFMMLRRMSTDLLRSLSNKCH